MSFLDIFNPIYRHQRRCRHFAASKKCPEYIRKFYLADMPKSESYIDELEIVSIDFETTGLDPYSDYLLSAGGISILENRIDFNTSFHFYVNNSEHIKRDAAEVNHIRPENLAEGKEPGEAALELMEKLAGKVVLTHCRFIETGFLKRQLDLKDSDPLPFLVLDTMAIEKTLHRATPNLDVRLFAIRKRRNLPSYGAHNALVDSLSTAEVLLAQMKDIFGSHRAVLKKLLSYSQKRLTLQ